MGFTAQIKLYIIWYFMQVKMAVSKLFYELKIPFFET